MLPTPTVTADARPYWEGAAAGRLMLQRCTACAAVRFLPAYLCPACWSEGVEWFQASGQGRVATFAVVHRAPLPAFAEKVPYVVALIDLDEGPRMMSNILGEDALEVAIGDPVEVCFEERGEEGFKVPQFRRSAEGDAGKGEA